MNESTQVTVTLERKDWKAIAWSLGHAWAFTRANYNTVTYSPDEIWDVIERMNQQVTSAPEAPQC